VGDLRQHRELRPHALHGDVGDRHGARTDDRLDLLRLHLAHAHAERTIEQADLHEASACDLERLVVGVPVVAADHDLAALIVAVVRHAIHAPHVEPGDARPSRQREGPEGARGHEPRVRPGMRRDHAARRLLQLVDRDGTSGRLAHGLERLRAHERAPQAGERARGIDDRLDAQPLKDGHDTLLSRRTRSTASAMSTSTAP
jgi:hypothetical protein